MRVVEPIEDAIRVERDDHGIVDVVFVRPERGPAVLSSGVLRELDRRLEAIHDDSTVRGVVFRGEDPRVFLAGADVEEIASVVDGFEAAEGARFGQRVFDRIARLPVPSACVIDGACMGGGTELALACAFRVASDAKATRIALPEVRIGIVPGFGGTQRLPRLVGLRAALDLILTGRSLDARRARRRGLVDAVAPAAYARRVAVDLLQRAAEDRERTTGKVRRGPGRIERSIDRFDPTRRFILDQARKKLGKKVAREAYPAPYRALEAVDASYRMPLPQGLDLEARLIGELVPSPTSKNLVWLFRSKNAVEKEDGGFAAIPLAVEKAAVIGAGVMGGGIARLVADKGIPVRIRDIRRDALLEALRVAHGAWRKQVARKRLDEHEARRRAAFLSTTLDLSGLSRADVVLEAVVESLDVKRKVLAEAESRLSSRAVFASNTSSIPIGEIAAHARYPARVVGLHFFNPVDRMPLVEVIASEDSSPEAVSTVRALALRLGKLPIVVRDRPGFLVNRILAPYLGEALRLAEEGVRVDAVDHALVAFGLPVGPFELMDRIGIDTARHVSQVLREAFGARLDAPTAVFDRLIDEGRLGTKSGIGFYKYRGEKKTVPASRSYLSSEAKPARELPVETVQERLVLSMVNEAAWCLEERVVGSPRELDLAMVMGTGFPPYRGGLLRYVDAVGVAVTVDRLSRLADAHGDRFRPAGRLREMVRTERRFYP